MRILVVGASSFIGFRLFKSLLEVADYDVLGTYFEHKKDDRFWHLDITDVSEMERVIIKTNPDVITWVAGSKNIKKCENDFEFAKTINTYPVKNLIELLERNNQSPHLLFISTDYVFDGEKGGFTDSDTPCPRTNYGKSNLLAEQYVQQSGLNFSIIRTSAVMGRNGAFFDWITHEMKLDQCIDLFDDVYFSPTPINRLLNCLKYVVMNKAQGIFHVCGNQRCNRFEFACALKDANPLFIAELLPTHAGVTNPFFQRDLSMISSDVFKDFETENMIHELEGEF